MKRKLGSSRKITEIAVFASLYAVLTWVLAPISYQMFQFRISESLKSLVVLRRHLIVAFVIGNALSNIFSPFVGVWELVWMPFMNLLGGTSAWVIGRVLKNRKLLSMMIGGFVYALWIAFGVSLLLNQLFGLPLTLTFIYILIPETICICGFSPVMLKIHERIKEKWG